MSDKPIYGYFKWTVQNGRPFPAKYIIEGDGILSESKKYYEDMTVQKWPLNAGEFKALSLDYLAKQYPLPANWAAIIESKRAKDMG